MKIQIPKKAGGGKITVSTPLTYTPTPEANINPALFQPMVTSAAKRPDLNLSELKIPGYDSDVSVIYGKLNEIQSKINSLPEPVLNAELPRLIQQYNYLSSPEMLNRAKVNYEEGQKAMDQLDKNKGADAWLTDSSGKVAVKTYDANGNQEGFNYVNKSEGIEGIVNGKYRPVFGADAWQLRNDASQLQDVIDGAGNTFHSSMRYTKGMERVNEEIDKWKTSAKEEWSTKIEKLGAIPMNEVRVAQMVLGEVGTLDAASSNEGQYSVAIKSAWNSLDSSAKDSLKNHAALRLIQGESAISPEVMQSLNIDYGQTLQNMKSTDTNVRKAARRDFDKMIELESKNLLSDQLWRNVGHSSKKERNINPSKFATDFAYGEADYKAELGLFQASTNWLTNAVDVKVSGGNSALQMKGASAGTPHINYDKGEPTKYGNSQVRKYVGGDDMLLSNGQPLADDLKQAVLSQGVLSPATELINVAVPHLDGRMLPLESSTANELANFNEVLVKYNKNKADDQQLLDAKNKVLDAMKKEGYSTDNVSWRTMTQMTMVMDSGERTMFDESQFGSFNSQIKSKNLFSDAGDADYSVWQSTIGKEENPDGTSVYENVDKDKIKKFTIFVPTNNQLMQRDADGKKITIPERMQRADALINSSDYQGSYMNVSSADYGSRKKLGL